MTKKDNNDIEELMKKATSEEDYEDDFDNDDDNNKSPKKVIWFTILGLAIFGVILVIGAFTLNKTEFEDKTEKPSWVTDDKDKISENVKGQYPIEIEKWASQPYDPLEFWKNESIEEVIIEKSRSLDEFYSSIFWMDSGVKDDGDDSQAFTHDTDKMYLEDGRDNPYYSYALKEDYDKAYVTYMERLINPLFGDWYSSQYYENSDSKDDGRFEVLSDMFSVSWWEDNVSSDDYSNLPIMAQWNNNDWDKYNIDSNVDFEGVMYGEIDNEGDRYIESEKVGDDEEGQEIMKVNTPIKYSYVNQDGEVDELTGTISLTLQSNQDYLNEENRVIIDEASLELDE